MLDRAARPTAVGNPDWLRKHGPIPGIQGRNVCAGARGGCGALRGDAGRGFPEVADLVRPESGDNCEATELTISCLEERNTERIMRK